MTYFPLYVDLHDQRVVVVGAGAVAARKLKLLLRSGARLSVVAPNVCAEVDELVEKGRVEWLGCRFDGSQLAGARLVIAATDDQAENARVAALAKAAGIWVNAVDQPDAGDVAIPAMVQRGDLTVAIGSDGQAPVLARRLRAQIEAQLPTRLGDLLALLKRHRPAIRARWPNVELRRRAYEDLLDGPIPALVEAGRLAQAEVLLDAVLQTPEGGASAKPENAGAGSVALVGAGPGDPGLLTLAALRELQAADVIVHDRLVSGEVLDLARRDADRISVGKCAGQPSIAQAEIDTLLLRLAREGRRVVRLKGGDPLIFARGGEELRALCAGGIPIRIVPGITAAQACAAYAGIPLTERDQAQALRLVTAHSQRDGDEVDWAALARGGETLALYMGVRQAPRVQARLIAHGLAADTPFACVENGTRGDQRVLLGRLDELSHTIRDQSVRSPALLLIGVLSLRAQAQHWFGAPPWLSPGLLRLQQAA
jgi:uroporphyrin-III C-methyltransferase/precorrin-2 dehydrogenase/sirohydrochlorin ferrochelatase